MINNNYQNRIKILKKHTKEIPQGIIHARNKFMLELGEAETSFSLIEIYNLPH